MSLDPTARDGRSSPTLCCLCRPASSRSLSVSAGSPTLSSQRSAAQPCSPLRRRCSSTATAGRPRAPRNTCSPSRSFTCSCSSPPCSQSTVSASFRQSHRRSLRRVSVALHSHNAGMVDPQLGGGAGHPARLRDCLHEPEVVPGKMLEGFGHGGLRRVLEGELNGAGVLRRPAKTTVSGRARNALTSAEAGRLDGLHGEGAVADERLGHSRYCKER